MRLIEERELRGWSKAELGRRSGIHPSTVGQIEGGRLQPYETQLKRLANALGWPGDPADLVKPQGSGSENAA